MTCNIFFPTNDPNIPECHQSEFETQQYAHQVELNTDIKEISLTNIQSQPLYQRIVGSLWSAGATLLQVAISTAQAAELTPEQILEPVKGWLEGYGNTMIYHDHDRGMESISMENRLKNVNGCLMTLTIKSENSFDGVSYSESTVPLTRLDEVYSAGWDDDWNGYKILLQTYSDPPVITGYGIQIKDGVTSAKSTHRAESIRLSISDSGIAEQVTAKLIAAAALCKKQQGQIPTTVVQELATPTPPPIIVTPKAISGCTTFFNTTDASIPAGYKLSFQKLAGKKGSTTVVDSCDMTAFYGELGTSSKQRFTNPQSFMKEEFWWSELGYVKVFDYETFYGHLAQSVRNKFFPRVTDIQAEARKKGEDISELTKTPTQLYNDIDKGVHSPGLWTLVNQFTQDYPLRGAYYFLMGYEPLVYVTGSSDLSSGIVSGTGWLIPKTKNEIYSIRWPFTQGQPFSEVQVRRYDSAGNITWYLNVDRSALASAIPDAKLTGRALGTVLKSYETPVETNMTSAQWKGFTSDEGMGSGGISILAGLQELFPDDTAVETLIQQRISAQITADAQMWDWTRGIKQWWNGP